MKLLLLLLVAPLAMGSSCPRETKGLDSAKFDYSDNNLKEAMKVSCGLKNFTAVFWSTALVKEVMAHVARDTIKRNATLCSPSCVQKMDDEHEAVLFEALSRSVREHLPSLTDADAKEYVDEVYEHEMKYRMKDLKKSNPFDFFGEELGSMIKLNFYHLSIDAQAAIAAMMKRTFGIVETPAVKQYRVDTAMKAFLNAEPGRDDEEIAGIIGQLQALVKEQTSFEKFDKFMKYDGNAVWIRPVEVTPAVELLYIQYRNLTNTDAKAFINEVLDNTKNRYTMTHQAEMPRFMRDPSLSDLWMATQNKNAFSRLSKEASCALGDTFPELFIFLCKNGYLKKKADSSFRI